MALNKINSDLLAGWLSDYFDVLSQRIDEMKDVPDFDPKEVRNMEKVALEVKEVIERLNQKEVWFDLPETPPASCDFSSKDGAA